MIFEVGEDESVTNTVARLVAEFENCSISDLPPLYDTINGDALDALFSAPPTRENTHRGFFSFDYSASTVEVRRGETITVSVE